VLQIGIHDCEEGALGFRLEDSLNYLQEKPHFQEKPMNVEIKRCFM
jgi:hypothetical protein